MERSVEQLLGEARDLFRRLNVQMLIVGGGLLLAYSVTFEEGYRSVEEQTRVRAGKLVLVERLSAGSETTKQLLRTQSAAVTDRLAKQQRACAGRNTAACATATLATQAAQRRQARLERKVKAYDRAIIENRKAVEQIRAKLRERVAFDLGSGVKLPFALAWAPIIWLVLLGGGLAAVGRARALFWGLVAAAARKARQAGASIETRSLTQVPFWLAPTGRPNRAVSISELRRIIGWTASWRRKNVQLYLVLLLFFALLLRVAWIGSLFTFVADLPGATVGAADAPALPWLRLLTAALVVIDIGLLLWLSFPQRISERIPPPVVNRKERRRFLYAGSAGVLLWIGSGLATDRAFRSQWTGLLDQSRKAFKRVPPKRSRAADLSKSGLAPGWYFNIKSKAVHLLHPDGKVRRALGLKPANLRKQGIPTSVFDRVPTRSSHYRFLIDQHRALDTIANGQWQAALVLLGIGFSNQDSHGAVLRRVDLMGAIVHRFGDAAAVRELAEYFTERMAGLTDAGLKTALSARVQRWTEPDLAEWRARKWSRQHPFRWAGRKIVPKPAGG